LLHMTLLYFILLPMTVDNILLAFRCISCV